MVGGEEEMKHEGDDPSGVLRMRLHTIKHQLREKVPHQIILALIEETERRDAEFAEIIRRACRSHRCDKRGIHSPECLRSRRKIEIHRLNKKLRAIWKKAINLDWDSFIMALRILERLQEIAW